MGFCMTDGGYLLPRSTPMIRSPAPSACTISVTSEPSVRILVAGPGVTMRPSASTTVSAASALKPQEGARTDIARMSTIAILPGRNQWTHLPSLPTMPFTSVQDAFANGVAYKFKVDSCHHVLICDPCPDRSVEGFPSCQPRPFSHRQQLLCLGAGIT
ncbi:hypothetical protein MESS2_650166 [Mesorhizobium metallidurans STM 2683]|uniref:Uncharacterized protein n=1 Tax=Mesorhizobium metallidurans STM 2683 TaxID=1297569 RepID=M5F7R3_9HYPH|nr:hypothetical protein MESS2_650166 [Mesorhizobium metallidurans STM 2683]